MPRTSVRRHIRKPPNMNQTRPPRRLLPLVQQLFDLRVEQNLTWEQLVEKTGFSQNTMYYYETGRIGSPGIFNLSIIADAIGYEIVLRKKEKQ